MKPFFRTKKLSIVTLFFLATVSLLAKGDGEEKSFNTKGELTSSKPTNELVPINVNTADVKTLSSLKGISKVRAQAIVNHREENGLYHSLKDLEKVPGIGRKTIEKNKDIIIFVSNPDNENNPSTENEKIESMK